MNKNERATWLRKKINSSINTFTSDPLWNHLLDHFKISQESVSKAYFDYEYDVYAFGNEIYNSLEIRLVLYLLSKKLGGWHVKKQNIVDSWLTKLWPCDLVDIGFGVPQKYHLNKTIKNGHGSIALVEYNQLSLDFAKEVFLFSKIDLDNIFLLNGGFFETSIRTKLNVSPNTWIFLDSLEHFQSPEAILEECISVSRDKTNYILSLPLGECVPVHTCSWDNKDEAIRWLRKLGFQIIDYSILHPNPDIEWFVHSLKDHAKMKELLLFATK